MNDPLRLCLLGASVDTGNEGVSALCLSILRGVFEREPSARVTVFDNALGSGTLSVSFGGRTFAYDRCGIRRSRRLYLKESLFRVRLAARFGGRNPVTDALRGADAALDITGGDSFTDLYGQGRFRAGSTAKEVALRLSGGLVLMPQTYGPFRDERTQRHASRLVRGAAAAWARDEQSFESLRGLLGGAFDATRHHSGVDVAFRLGAEEPARPLPDDVKRVLDRTSPGPVVGFNVSGLVYNRADEARRAYGLGCDYRAIVHEVIGSLAGEDGTRIILVPHVHAHHGDYRFESDHAACESVRAALPAKARESIVVLPELGAAELKWVISRTDWFCGTRMHSAIAALSSGVPCAALAYSLKTRGVFATCGQEEHVADLRSATTEGAIAAVVGSWRSREAARASLAARLPATLAAADRQMDEVVAVCRRLAASKRRSGAPASA
jgi:polysaccharide pyruvyl transferase WcaK-like protein